MLRATLSSSPRLFCNVSRGFACTNLSKLQVLTAPFIFIFALLSADITLNLSIEQNCSTIFLIFAKLLRCSSKFSVWLASTNELLCSKPRASIIVCSAVLSLFILKSLSTEMVLFLLSSMLPSVEILLSLLVVTYSEYNVCKLYLY